MTVISAIWIVSACIWAKTFFASKGHVRWCNETNEEWQERAREQTARWGAPLTVPTPYYSPRSSIVMACVSVIACGGCLGMAVHYL